MRVRSSYVFFTGQKGSRTTKAVHNAVAADGADGGAAAAAAAARSSFSWCRDAIIGATGR